LIKDRSRTREETGSISRIAHCIREEICLGYVIADDKLPEFADENLPVFVQE